MKSKHKYVVLEHIALPDRGMRFWTRNAKDVTKRKDGLIAYKIVLHTNSRIKAMRYSNHNKEMLATYAELKEYFNQFYEMHIKTILQA